MYAYFFERKKKFNLNLHRKFRYKLYLKKLEIIKAELINCGFVKNSYNKFQSELDLFFNNYSFYKFFKYSKNSNCYVFNKKN